MKKKSGAASTIGTITLLVLALLAAGCASTKRTDEESPLYSDKAAELIGKLDEALIGTSGPEQVEDAIETLDQRTQSDPPLVRELGASPPSLPAPSDLFERIRAGFALEDVDHPSVDKEERWFASHPAYLDRTFKRGERYLYHIVNEIEARKLPMELALLPVVESAFNPVAYSRARASGLWQFIPDTGRRYGLKQNWYYDGRRDVLAATTAALDYLEFLAAEFNGDWLLAVAAYNAGEANVARAIRRNLEAGKPTDFFSLRLPPETRAYVPKLLAIRRIVANPAAHGLEFAPIPNEPFFEKVDIDGQIDLNVAAELAGISKEELLALNPAFNHWVTDPDGPHYLLIPVAHAARFAEALKELPPEQRVRVVHHRVRKGDTLSAIASRYGVSVAAIRQANNIRGSIIYPGQDLLITAAPPRAGTRTATMTASTQARAGTAAHGATRRYVVRRGDTLWSIARAHGTTAQRLAAINGISLNGTLAVGQQLILPETARLAAADTSSISQAITYVVRSGDTLSRIAHRFRVALNDLLGWNDLEPNSIIRPGQKLVMYVDNHRAGI
ncbi:MAG: LysM peptidoglycan-binding domain-containing protein [Gammaproteobacteria bacterium]|nr:lytic transglycosylase [Gammaproteobacteria bacterium]